MKIVSDIKQVVVPRRLRVGVLSDSQLTPFRHKEPTTFESNLLAACRTLKEQECAFVVFAGDICNRASKNGYETFKRCFNTVFGDDKPVVQAIMGNHDYYAHLSPRRLFEREKGERQRLTLYGLKEGVRDVTVTAVGAFGERSEGSLRIEGVRVLARKYRRKLAPEIWY